MREKREILKDFTCFECGEKDKVLNRFNSKLKVESSGCIVWLGPRDDHGYGIFSFEGGPKKAHRISFQMFKGKLLPRMCIDHICKNTSCVNPEHLRQVTYRENVVENSNSWMAINAKKTHCKRGHKFSFENTLIREDGSRKCRQCQVMWVRIHREQRKQHNLTRVEK